MSRLRYRSPLADDGDGYAKWLRDLRESSGVYVIRDKATHEPLYVGESHTGSLYDTITRHFQRWAGDTAGTVYAAERVEVAVRTTPPNAAASHQADLIRRLEPLDNRYHQEADPAEFQDD